MKEMTPQTASLGAWGLHITSYFMAALPVLQVVSLILAITVSLVTLHKLLKKKNHE
jgi:hypothetical protein